ncbi:biotin--[acetyl-CoA-carboxylase] ligase [bacterium]|nr:biotin--[acetyl-CoA-carboxylase] ligase [bacterium]
MHDSSFQLCLSKFFYSSDLSPYPCFYLDQVSSTQDATKYLLQKGTSNKTTVFTHKQTQGRGRNHSQWQTLAGHHLFFSHTQSLKIPTQQVAKLSLLAGMILRNTLENVYAIKTKIKWPNDLYIDDKKLSGILCETFQVKQRQHYIIGIGINIKPNINKTVPDNLSPAFAQDYCKEAIHPWQLLGEIIHELDSSLNHLEDSFVQLHNTFKHHDYLFNKTISVLSGKDHYQGQAKGINDDGALLLKVDSNKIIPIYSGHIDL